MEDVEIRLSGTFEVRRSGVPVAVPGRRLRALLAMLALSARRTVSVDALARGIWDDDPPARVRGSLQTYIGRLRHAVGAEPVVTDAAGYRLDVPADAVDLVRFEQLVVASGDSAVDERALLDEALALWGGEPFGDPPSEWIGRHVVPELTERYLDAIERRIDLDLSDGDASAHLPRLRNLIEAHPLRETLWARLFTTLDDAGRTAEALDQYESLRSRLAEELGVDPSPDLQRIHRRLLTDHPPRNDADIDADTGRPSTKVPHQLPPAVAGFSGRSEQLAALDSTVDADESPLLALHGPGGVGKTALAVHWARRNDDRFPDGQLFVDLRGYGPGEPADPLEALDALLRGLGVPGEQMPADVEARGALLRTELSGRRVLVVLDNARGAAQVRPLLTGGPTTTIVTSRSQLRGLVSRDGARRVPVEPMPTDDAVALLAGRFDLDADEHAAELRGLADLCGHLPVALTVAAERAGRDRGTRIADVRELLRDERDRLATLTDWADDPLSDVRAIFSWSYRALDTDTADMFRLLGCHHAARVSTGAAAALAAIDTHSAARLLDRLTDRHLLSEVSLGWYEVHDLPHEYAAELAAGEPDETAAAVRRLRSWYLHSIRNARYRMQPPRIEYPVPDSETGTDPTQFATAEQAYAWLTAHRSGIRAMLDDAVAEGADDTVARTVPYLYTFLRRSGAVGESVDVFATATAAARRAGDTLVEAACTYLWGCCCGLVGSQEAALSHLGRARDLFAGLRHRQGSLNAEIALGIALHELGRLADAVDAYRRALEDLELGGSRVEKATVLNNLATTYLELGRADDALEAVQRAVHLEREGAGDFTGLATTLVTLGEAQSAARLWSDAVASLDEALLLLRDAAFVSNEIVALKLRGVAYRELGDHGAARRDWHDGITRFEEIDADSVPDASADEFRRLLETISSAADDEHGPGRKPLPGEDRR